MKISYRLKSAKQLVDGDWRFELEITKKSFWPWKKDQIENVFFIGRYFWYRLPNFQLVRVTSDLDRILSQWRQEAEARQKYEKLDD